jgi:hypothetical protein
MNPSIDADPPSSTDTTNLQHASSHVQQPQHNPSSSPMIPIISNAIDGPITSITAEGQKGAKASITHPCLTPNPLGTLQPHHHGGLNDTLNYYYYYSTRQHSLPPPRRRQGGLWRPARALSECTGVSGANSAVGFLINYF